MRQAATRLREWAVNSLCLGLAPLARLRHRLCPSASCTILCYHGVADVGDPLRDGVYCPDVHFPIATFARQIDHLATRFHMMTVGEVAECVRTQTPLPRGAAAITFDDAYANVYETSWPMLRDRGLRATLFVTAGLVGSDDLHWPDIVARAVLRRPSTALREDLGVEPPRVSVSADPAELAAAATRVIYAMKSLPDADRRAAVERLREIGDSGAPEPYPGSRVCTAEQIREMHQQGLEVGSHSLTHPILTEADEDAVLADELSRSRELLGDILGETVDLLAYPDGAHDDRVVLAASEAGYVAAVTLRGTPAAAGSHPFRLGRICPLRSFPRFQVQATGLESSFRNRWSASA